MRLRLLAAAALVFSLIGFEFPRIVEIPENAYGVFQICDVSAPVFRSDGDDQSVVDAEDSALIRPWGYGTLIADHAGSKHGGEWRVNEWPVGTTGFLITSQSTKAYRLTAVYLGERRSSSYAYRGRDIYPARGDIICVSCGRGDETYIAYFEYSGEIP